MIQDDLRHMSHALALGRRGLGRVWPNPAVGCVLVKDGRVVGRGRTADGGRPHAETVALAMAGSGAQGATAYVTLEPCSHHGQTPPCAEALIAAGVSRVVIGTGDPNPDVDGKGIALLRAADKDVAVGVLEAKSRKLAAGFISRIVRGRPKLTLKLALSFDGRIATASGESKWITGPEARRYVHGLRASHDAVLVGGGTARADNPELTVRELGMSHQPVRIVATRNLNLPWPNQLSTTIGNAPLWLVHGEGQGGGPTMAQAKADGAELIPAKVSNGHLDPADLLAALGAKGLTRVFCEGGGMLAASLLAAGVVDDLIVFSAGKAIGAEGQPGIGALGLSKLTDAPTFALQEVRSLGNDTMTHWSCQSDD